MADRGLQGWSTDPFGLHQERYFSAGHPTKLVRDGTVESYEEPPSDTFVPAGAAAGADRSGRATPAAPGASVGTAPPPLGGDPPGRPLRRGEPAFVRGYPQDPSYSPDPGYPSPGYPWDSRYGPRPRRRRRAGLAAAIAAIAAATIVGVIVGQKGSRSPTTTNQTLTLTSPAAFVTHSAKQTLAARTADLTVSGTIQVSGQSVTVDGTGEINFDTNAAALDLNMGISGQSVVEKEMLVTGNAYFAVSVNGKSLTQEIGGRDWIQLPVQQAATANLAGSDPASSLSVLEQQGSTVRPLGSKTIDGVNCTGYAVTPSRQAIITGIRAENAKLGLPSTITDQELQQIQGMTPPTVTIWSDAQGLVREISVNLQLNVQGAPASVGLVMDLSHYGVPVSVTAPPPSDTMSFNSFLQDLGRGRVTA